MRVRSFLLLYLILAGPSVAAAGEDITVAGWNIENLFDSRRDSDHDGEIVLSEKQLDIKMAKLAEVIRYLDADIVGLMEVENRAILRRLTTEYLRGDGYDYVMLVEESDPRGIDVALIAKIPFAAYSFEIPGHTRGVLACRFATPSGPFYVLVNHWKSRRDGGEAIRAACARRNLELATELLPRLEGAPVPILLIGDLNDQDDDPSVAALETAGLTNLLRGLPASERWTYPYWDSRRKKVHYNAFDHVLANPAMSDGQGIDIVPGSAAVVRPPMMLRKRRLNDRDYDWLDDSFARHVGYSDHLPVRVTVRVP